MRALLIGLCLFGCASVAPPPSPDPPPLDLTTCPPPTPTPRPLPRVRTTEQLARFATALEIAREAERKRADICAGRLEDLNRWIKAKAP